jgi:uncharacterized protein
VPAPAVNLPLRAEDFAELEGILDTLRQRLGLTPRWEYCEGFMAALICCRRRMEPDETLPVLLTSDGTRQPLVTVFADAHLQQRFVELWTRRWNGVTQALDTQVTSLEDAAAYQPEVVDLRAAEAALPAEQSSTAGTAQLPSFGQLWALGFMAAVHAWPQEWSGPRNKAAQHWRETTLGLLHALTLDDCDVPTLSPFADAQSEPPTVSEKRMSAFGDAIWAVYNMRAMWRTLGPRIETLHAVAAPGRNEPCLCGSGKKYKKCCA